MSETDMLVHLTTESGTRIDTTEGHPFFVEGKGWVRAGELEAGDRFVSQDGSAGTVTDIEVEYLDESVRVYNLEIEGSHTYFVSDDAVLVHNMCELDDEALVVRGGTCTAERFSNGSGVITDVNGNLNGVSMNCMNECSLKELSELIPNGKVGVTTVGEIRNNGGQVTSSPSPKNPYHAIVSGITAELEAKIFNVVPNPSK